MEILYKTFSRECCTTKLLLTTVDLDNHQRMSKWFKSFIWHVPQNILHHDLLATSLVGSCSFTSWQHLGASQVRHRLVTVYTHADFIVLPNWEIRPPTPWAKIPLNPIILTLSEPVPSPTLMMLSTRLQCDKYKFDKSLVWLDREANCLSPRREDCSLPIRSSCTV